MSEKVSEILRDLSSILTQCPCHCSDAGCQCTAVQLDMQEVRALVDFFGIHPGMDMKDIERFISSKDFEELLKVRRQLRNG